MRNSLLLLFAGLMLIACKTNTNLQKDNAGVFTKELLELKAFYSIPGLSAIITKNN